MYYRVFGSIPGLCPLDANNVPFLVATTKNISDVATCLSPRRHNQPGLRTTSLELFSRISCHLLGMLEQGSFVGLSEVTISKML